MAFSASVLEARAGFMTGKAMKPVAAASRVSVRRPVVVRAGAREIVQDAGKLAAALAASALLAGPVNAITYNELQGLSYNQVKGSGIANTCPVIEGGSSNLKDLKAGSYKMQKFCLEPSSITVKETAVTKGGEPEFVKTKLMTRLTYTLDEISADFKVDGSGNVELIEQDGIDYAPVTVQLPGGERVPFLFTIKELTAKGNLNNFGGQFTVPSYRGSTFLDPKGRGGATGYDTAVALPAGAAGDSEEVEKENIKRFVPLKGEAVFSVAKVDPTTGEIAGVFESIQPSDTDMGAKAPKDVKISGLWYGQLS